jgi:outer membrane protein TolC
MRLSTATLFIVTLIVLPAGARATQDPTRTEANPDTTIGPAPAPPKSPTSEEPLTLTQALERAIAGNVDLRKERVNILIADANALAARGQFDFLVTAALNFQRSTQPALTATDISAGFTNDLAFNVGIMRPLESGGQIRLQVQNDAIKTNSRLQCGSLAVVPQTCSFYNSNLGLTFNHPLLRGLGVEITEANLRKQRIQKDIALLNRQTRASNILRDVITAYWELAYATQDLAIRRSAVELAREQLRITKAQINRGRLAPIDQAAVERAIGDRLQEVAASEQNLAFRTLDLRRLLSVPADPSLPPFTAADMPSADTREIDAPAELRRALETNPQLRSLKTGLQLTAIDVQTALDTVRPRLDFVGTIGSRGRDATLGETLAHAAGFEEITWSAGLNFQAAVENRTANGQYRAAVLAAEQNHLDAGTLELTIRDTVMRTVAQIRAAGTRTDLAKQTVGFALQNLEAERARFAVGRSTNNDVLLRQQELKSAEIAVVRAIVDVLESDAALSAITSEILERYRVVLKGL